MDQILPDCQGRPVCLRVEGPYQPPPLPLAASPVAGLLICATVLQDILRILKSGVESHEKELRQAQAAHALGMHNQEVLGAVMAARTSPTAAEV
jgi:hypothetical protein